jgi:hypothetical protein
MAKYYDNTRISTYKECPRKFQLRHKLHYVREGLAPPLVFGLSWHEAMDIIWGGAHSDVSDEKLAEAAFKRFCEKWLEEGAPPAKEFAEREELSKKWGNRTPFIGYEMLLQYVLQRRPWIRMREVIAIEPPFVVDIPGMEDTYYIGRLDKVVQEPNGDIIGIEHKTTALYDKAKGFRDSYIAQWSPNSQVDGYTHYGHSHYGKKFKSMYIDAALVHKTNHNVFKFIPVDRQADAIRVFLEETKNWIERIESETLFPKNTGSCSNYAGCGYREVCKYHHDTSSLTEPPVGFKKEKWEPFNILNISELGLEPEDER